MNNNIAAILEKYIEGKDQDRYGILEEIYSPEATVSFEINTEDIQFPGTIRGNVEIAKILSMDFNRKYHQVKTYYLSKDSMESESLEVSVQKWLVAMRERNNGSIRIGTGYYDWEFEYDQDSRLQIKKHKIFIHTMLELPADKLEILQYLHATLSYPWEDREKAVQILQEFKILKDVNDYLSR